LLSLSLSLVRTHAQLQRHYGTAAAADGQPMWLLQLKKGFTQAMSQFMTADGPWDV